MCSKNYEFVVAYGVWFVEFGLCHDDVDEILAAGERAHGRQRVQQAHEQHELLGVHVDEHELHVLDERVLELFAEHVLGEESGYLDDEKLDGALAHLLEHGRRDLVEYLVKSGFRIVSEDGEQAGLNERELGRVVRLQQLGENVGDARQVLDTRVLGESGEVFDGRFACHDVFVFD